MGTLYAIYTADNNGRLIPLSQTPSTDYTDPFWIVWRWNASPVKDGLDPKRQRRKTATEQTMHCPMTEKWTKDSPKGGAGTSAIIVPWWVGGTFRVWCTTLPGYAWTGSYGMQEWARSTSDPSLTSICWTTTAVKNANDVPVYLDCVMPRGEMLTATEPPPQFDAIPFWTLASGHSGAFCMDRHSGGTNSLFLDWSVRKVGLKELWTLKWRQDWNTRGPWTKQGGAKPEDWPEWMRNFKDY
jgi:prepilin-type processing-associated H-X9-DG protein